VSLESIECGMRNIVLKLRRRPSGCWSDGNALGIGQRTILKEDAETLELRTNEMDFDVSIS
jgi:hypothetical protein